MSVFDKKKKSSFQEAIKRKFSLTNLNQLRKVYLKKKKQTKQNKTLSKKENVTWHICNHSLPNRILPIKVSFDVQNIKLTTGLHWPGGVVLPLTSQACLQEQSLLDRTLWKEKNNDYSLIAKKCISRCVRHQAKVECFPELESSCMFFRQRYTKFVPLATCYLNAITWEDSGHFAIPPLVSPRNVIYAQKFHTDDASLHGCGLCFWSVEKFALSSQKHYTQIQGSDASSAWTICARSSSFRGKSNGGECTGLLLVVKVHVFLCLEWQAHFSRLQ